MARTREQAKTDPLVTGDVSLVRGLILPFMLIAGAAVALSFSIAVIFPDAPLQKLLLQTTLVPLLCLMAVYYFYYRPLLKLSRSHREVSANAVQLQSRLMELAFHDHRTRLPNKRMFEELLDDEICRLSGPNDAFSLLLLRLGHLSEINDVLGYNAGNDVIREVARRLKSVITPPDVAAHISSNEFAILVSVARFDRTQDVIKAVAHSLEPPITVEGTAVNVIYNMGHVSCPFHGKAKEQLLRHADVAMRQAKTGDKRVAVYDRRNDPFSRRRLLLFSGLKEAVYNDRGLSLLYQPKANFSNMQLDSVEALSRWEHARLGAVSPAEFIPVAEASGLIRQLTYRVIEHSLRQVQHWFENGVPLKTAINLSAKDIQDKKLIGILKVLLEESKIPPELIEVEITESAFMDNTENTIKNIISLKELGITVTIDDFGTGYSSLSYLSKLPIDTLKIDQSFIKGLESNRENQVIVKTCIDLAHSLGMKTVAEGVETESDFTLLRDQGCDYLQGYLIGRPMDSDSLLVCVDQFGRKFADEPATGEIVMPTGQPSVGR